MGMGDRIKERRLFMGYTQDELGALLGLQKSAVAKYENGRVENIKRSVIAKMAKVLCCSPSYLMGWEELEESSKYIVRPYIIAERTESIPDELLNAYMTLNEVGKKEAIKRVVELTEIPRYKDSATDEEPLLNAAHERTDIEVTDEMRKHDEGIMDDDDF